MGSNAGSNSATGASTFANGISNSAQNVGTALAGGQVGVANAASGAINSAVPWLQAGFNSGGEQIYNPAVDVNSAAYQGQRGEHARRFGRFAAWLTFSKPQCSGILPPDPNKGIQTLSGILGIKQQQRALQTGQATQASAQAKATVDTQNASENQSLARLLADPVGNGIVDANGNPTKGAQSIVLRAAPTTGSDAFEKVVNAATSKVRLNSAVNNLRGEQRQTLVNALAGVAADPNATYDDAKATLQNVVDANKGTENEGDYKTIQNTLTTALDHVSKLQKDRGQVIPSGQEAWRTGALNFARGGLGAPAVVGPGGIAAPQPTTVDNGGAILPGTVAPALQGGGFTPAGAPIAKVTPPAVVTGPNGQIIRVPTGGAGLPPQVAAKARRRQSPSNGCGGCSAPECASRRSGGLYGGHAAGECARRKRQNSQ